MDKELSNTEGARHQFSADRPITSQTEDRLGRADFANSIASSIKGWKDQESLVIALYGAWGSGKSSIKNMVLESLRPIKSDPALTIIEFNPWQWSGQTQLAEAFFQEIGMILGRSDGSEDGKRRAAKWRTYGTYLTLGASLTKSLKILLPVLGLPGSGIADMLAKGMEQSAGLAHEGSKGIGDQGVVQQQTLSEIKKELSQSLRELKSPILVVLDDIDRLTTEEIRLLFQLVKGNADFPNVVYLLLFQRDIIERSLDSPPSINGREFLEKIVQVGFDIPRIEKARLEKILFAGLDELFADKKVGKHFDQQRWGNLFLGGLRPFFLTLRDVYRYLATLSFHVSLFRGTGSFEVNPLDLIALEVLRVFEPGVYQQLPDMKSELTDLHQRRLSNAKVEAQMRERLHSLVNESSEPNRPSVEEIIKQLFPLAQWVFDSYGSGSGMMDTWFREQRVAHSDVFDRYFCFTIPQGDISQADLDRVLSLVADREGLVAELRSLKQRQLLDVAIDRLEPYKTKINLQHAVPFITALFDVGEELLEHHGATYSPSPVVHANRIIYWFLKQEKEIEKRGQVLKEATQASIGLYLPMRTTSLEEDEEKRKKDPDAFNVTDADLIELQQICVRKVEAAADSGQLSRHPQMHTILSSWSRWGQPEKPKQWAQKLIESTDGAIAFLTSCLSRSTSQGMKDHISEEHWRIYLTSVEQFVPIDALENVIARVAPDAQPEKVQKALKAFRKAIKRRQEGKSEDGRWDDDE